MDPPRSRRRFLAVAAVGATTPLAGCSSGPFAGTAESPGRAEAAVPVPEAVGLRTVIGGLDAPLAVAFAPDADRRYVAERDGRILCHGSDGLRDDLFLDLRDSVETGAEKGLLGMALHPDFPDDRRLFVRYSGPLRSRMPEEYSHTFVLAEFEVTEDGTRARRDSERAILEIAEPADFHNGGDLAFGPEGYLYVSVGDGGGSVVESGQGPGSGGNAQNVTETLLGSILRIDVDEAASTAPQADSDDGDDGGDRPARGRYGVPDDNPLVGRDGLDELYAWGFRNPWRLSFDGDELYVGDVGQDSYEEVNLVESGGNYGWKIKEGTRCYKADDCPDETADDGRGGEALRDPIVEYPHEGEPVSGVSVVGGHVYRGSALPELEGSYVFGDFVPEGRLFVAARPEDDGLWPTAAVEIADGEKLTRLLSFGRDEDGDIYALGTGSDGGGLFRIAPAG